MKTSYLFTPVKIRSVEFRNRIAVSPMCMYSSENGFSNNWHLVHLGTRAVGGAGLVFTEATAVAPEGRISPEDLGIWMDEHVDGLKEIVDFVKEQGSIAGIQLAHAGRKASTRKPWLGGGYITEKAGGWVPVGPSPLPFSQDNTAPHELDELGLKKVIGDFKKAAERAVNAGFEVLEIHAAHGYLLHEFLSPITNKRTDQYGGTLDNRCRLLLEIVETVRAVLPQSHPLFVRISATDWVDNGWNENDSIALAKKLKERGVDLIDCSSGGLVPDAVIPVKKGYQVGFAHTIRSKGEILTGAVGLINTAQQAEEILRNGQADFIFMAREMLREPYFPMKAARELGVELNWPSQYARAKR